MKKLFLAFLSALCFSQIQAQELRGTWIARNTLTSKESIAIAIDSLAKNNFNVVYINLWSRGYPLWKSQTFYNETGLYIDPAYQGRDILAETISEAHRVGIHVEAWFEYGFVGGWSGNMPSGVKGPIFQTHPDWVAKKKDGTEIDGSNFYWMIHTKPEVQNFLIAMCTELVRNYDLDGIELDRIRYSSLEYGYDAFTDSLYKAEHNGTPPPQNSSDTEWIRWRADKLNSFMGRAYDSIKAVNPHINVSNAPSLYSSGSYTSYQSFCQDWAWWVNNDKVDNVQVQMYVSTASSMSSILNYLNSSLTSRKSKIFPAIAITPGGSTLSNQEIGKMIDSTRRKGYGGNAIWYYTDLAGVFPYLKANYYKQKTHPPFSTADWRELTRTVSINDTLNAVRKGSWTTSTLPGLSGYSLKTNQRDSASIEYFFDVPESGIYEVYSFNVIASDRNDSANYLLFEKSGNIKNIFIDQTASSNKRWTKLGDAQLEKGRRKVAELTSRYLDAGDNLSADAVYIKLNRKLSPDVTVNIDSRESGEKKSPKNQIEIRLFPNPAKKYFNYSIFQNAGEILSIKILNLLGETVTETYVPSTPNCEIPGKVDVSNLASGVYILSVRQGAANGLAKLLIQH